MSRLIVGCTMLAALVAAGVAEAQSTRGGVPATRQEIARAQGIPPGHMPPAGLCRVWYDGVPSGRQPAATSCREAESIAARTRNTRVIYGADVYDRRYPGHIRGDRSPYPGNDRAVPRVPGTNRDPRASRVPYSDRRSERYTTPAFQNGYRDGLEKGREDGRRSNSYDPVRHSRYRSATNGYRSEYGTRVQYQTAYRDGFAHGYSEGYRVNSRVGR